MAMFETTTKKNDSELLERVLRHIIKMFVKGSLVLRERQEVIRQDVRPIAARLRTLGTPKEPVRVEVAA